MNYFQLLDKLEEVYDSLEGKELSSQAIVKRLNRVVPFKECRIIKVDSLCVNNNMMVSGIYEPEQDEANEPCIEIEIIFPKRRDNFEFSEEDFSRDDWYEMCVDLASVLGHEFVHMHQFRRRGYRDGRYYNSRHSNPSVKENQEYFGIPDEVDAYAFTCAVAMCDPIPGTCKLEDTVIYQIYSNIFDKKDPVVLKLRKLATKYFKRLEKQYHATHRTR